MNLPGFARHGLEARAHPRFEDPPIRVAPPRRGAVRRRALTLERLESRELLSVAHDLATAIAPYQTALTAALNAATQLPLVGKQLNQLSEFTTELLNAEEAISGQVGGLVSDGHHQVVVSLPPLSKTFSFSLGLDAFLKATATGDVSASIQPKLTIAYDVSGGSATFDAGQSRFDIGFGLSLPGFQGTFSLNGLLFTKAVDAGTSFNGDLGFRFNSGADLTPEFSGTANVQMGLAMSFADPALHPSFNPTFRATLAMNWGFGSDNQMAAPSIALRNFGLEADGFLHSFLGDVITTVQKYTKPMQPFFDIFQTPVPILSAFNSGETFGDLMLKGANVSPVQEALFKTMVKIVSAVNTIDLSGSTGGAVIPFGSVSITGDPRLPGGFGFDTSGLSNAIDSIRWAS